jgi:hypothetical protein
MEEWSSSRCADDREWSFLQREQEGCEMGSDRIKGCDRNVFNTNNKRCEELTLPKSQTNRDSIVGNLIQQEQSKPGGKLNPNFVEFLMGYPMNWTKIDQAE